ncbi:MAG: hypothetical protein HYW89_03380 [Candidatus Sungiibacteriota bacterium]|uniref:Uncharacterized protein n=1 Tax=Candidatus Sungiibacteriota bacterium TaxID=2750080 RepID=A0A7T5UPM9_9BACT|nr:MAG: hypothetical protein HYW89_03380 [Candidatus Sungbacteria bacterium]
MDFSKLKNLVKHNGDKFVFVENGEPEMVMMSFKEYEKLATNGKYEGLYPTDHGFRPHNAEFADLGFGHFKETEVVLPGGGEGAGLPVRLEDIRLEDLPI